MAQGKEYFAFISYKREDEKWAKWLQHKLEHYHLPVNVRKENPSLPQSIRPVFKDTSELAAGVLADEIHEALENSKYLIVICSPRAAQSKWVGKEVQTFIDMGRSDKIIPFIIGGTPFSDNPEDECFPSALLNLPKEQELLGVNINEMGREAAVVKVVARMFGLKFDTLWQRYEREQKRKRWMWIGGSVLLALFGLGIGGYFVRQNGIIERQNERLQQDSVTMAEHLTRIQNDSIKLSVQNDSIVLQNNLIISQRDSIARSIQQIKLSNSLLAEERDNVIKANTKMTENHVRFLSNVASQLIDRGDVHTALTLLLHTTNKPPFSALPIIPEIEAQLRRATYLYNKGDGESICLLHSLSLSRDVFFSSDNKYIISGNDDGSIRIWDTKTKMELPPIRTGTQYSCMHLAVSPKGDYIASHGIDTLKVFNLNTRELYKTYINEYTKSSTCLTFSPDSKCVVCGGHDGLCLIDIHTGKVKVAFEKNTSYISSIDFNGDGSRIVTGMGDGTIKIWDVPTHNCVKILHSEGEVRSVVFANDSVVVFGGNNVYVWNIQTNKKEKFFSEDNKITISHIALHPNKKEIAISMFSDEKGRIVIADINSKNIIKTLYKEGEGYNGLAFSNDGTLLISDCNGQIIRIWDVSKAKIYLPQLRYDNVSCFRFLCNDSISLLTDWKNTGDWENLNFQYQFQMWDNKIGQTMFHMPYDTIAYRNFCINPDETMIALYIDAYTGLFDWKNRKMTEMFIGTPLSFSPDGSLLLVSRVNDVYEVPVSNVEHPTLITRHGSSVETAIYSPKGDRIVTASWDGTVKIFDAKTKQCLHVIFGNNQCFCFAKFSPDGKFIVTGSEDQTVRVYDSTTYQEIKCFKGHTHWVEGGNFSPDSQYLVTTSGADPQIIIWDLKTMRQLLTINERVSSDSEATFTKDGKYIYFCGDNGIRLFEFKSMDKILKEAKVIIHGRTLTKEERENFYLE